MRMPRGMLTIIARPKPTKTRRKVLPISLKKFPVLTMVATSAKVSNGFGTKVGEKKRLRIHQIRIKVRMDPALKLKSISACLARPGRGLAIGVDSRSRAE